LRIHLNTEALDASDAPENYLTTEDPETPGAPEDPNTEARETSDAPEDPEEVRELSYTPEDPEGREPPYVPKTSYVLEDYPTTVDPETREPPNFEALHDKICEIIRMRLKR